jgi:DNA polymerase-3 subunit beta
MHRTYYYDDYLINKNCILETTNKWGQVKLSITQENLKRALASVGRIVSNRTSLPVLSNILITTDGNRLRLSATNLELGINYWIGSKIEQEGSLTVPSRLLAEFVNSLPHGNLELESTDTALTIRTPHYESQLNGISADEFPPIPQVTSKPALSVDAGILRDALVQVVIAASLDEARPVLAGVYLYTEESTLYVVATDSYRLAEKQLVLTNEPNEPLQVIVPVRTMQELIRLLAEHDGEVELYRDENQVMFRTGEIELTSRLIDGQFPNYRQIIPKQATTSFDIETSEFSKITKVASLFARESAGSLKLEIRAEGEVRLVSSDSEVGGSTATAECMVNGDDAEISLNARYLQDALAAMKSPAVTFAVSGKLSACVLSPFDPKDEAVEADYLHIIMPLRT